MTDRGTLIMRNSPASSRHRLGETQHYHSPSLAPFAIDLEDEGEPARNSDALGTLRRTSNVDYSRSTTNASFWSGLFAGLATLGVGVAIAFTAFTSEPSFAGVRRDVHLVQHVASSLSVETAELTDTKLAPKKKHRARKVVAAPAAGDEAPAEAAAPEPAPAPEPSETE